MSSNARRPVRPTTRATSSNARRQRRPIGKATTAGRASASSRGTASRETASRAGAQARPTKPAGLALSVTLLATLMAGGYVSRGHASRPSGLALPPGAAVVAPGGSAQPGAAAPGGAGGQSASWRPTDVAPHAAPAQRATPAPAAAPAPVPTPRPPAPAPAPVTVNRSAGDWISWAMLDRRTGAVVTGGDTGTNSTESMVKAWIAADYLRGLGNKEPGNADLDLLRRMIRDSDDQAAETLYLRRGNDTVIGRLISICGLTDTRQYHGWWSLTQMSARDAARMGDCIADGKATNARWTAWLLNEMRQVRGEGRFGIAEVRPGVAVKNGWTLQGDGTWHVNCLAVADGWSLSVLTRYPARYGLGHGAELCRSVTRQLAP